MSYYDMEAQAKSVFKFRMLKEDWNELLKKVILLLLIIVILGCGLSYPPDDIAEDIFLQLAEKNTKGRHEYGFYYSWIKNGTSELVKLRPINKYKQKIQGEEYSVIDYEFAYRIRVGEPYVISYDHFRVAYIERGNYWEGYFLSKSNWNVDPNPWKDIK